eukprot:COSAG06_NODE_57_length_27525_cov_14.855279_27_plen_82_part_00
MLAAARGGGRTCCALEQYEIRLRRNRTFAHIRTVAVPRAAALQPGRPLAHSAASTKASAAQNAPALTLFQPLDLTDLIGSN